MRNYFVNPDCESPSLDTSATPWVTNNEFAVFQDGATSAYVTDRAVSGTHSVKITWPTDNGTGKAANVVRTFNPRGIFGKWRWGCKAYIPAGSPGIKIGVTFGAESPAITTTDQWVDVEAVFDVAEGATNVFMHVHTDGATFPGSVYLDDFYLYPGASGSDPNEPDISVEISWTGRAFEVSPTWDDITDYVQAFDPGYGRSSEIGSVEAGSANLTLDNTDGRFSPKRAASPYFPNVTPRRPVRIRATWDGAVWPIFRGLVERWPASTSAGVTDVTVPCTDPLSLIAKKKLENPFLSALRTAMDATEVWPLDDGPEAFAPLINPSGDQVKPYTPIESLTHERASGAQSPSVEAGATDILPNETGLGAASVTGIEGYEGTYGSTEFTARALMLEGLSLDTLSAANGGTGWSFSFWHSYDGTPEFTHPDNTVVAANTGIGMAFRLESDPDEELILSVTYWPRIEAVAGYPSSYTAYISKGPIQFGSGAHGYLAIGSQEADYATRYMEGNHVVVAYSPDCRGDGSNIQGVGLFVNGIGQYHELDGANGETAIFPNRVWPKVRAVMGSNVRSRPEEAFGNSGLMSHNFRAELLALHNRPLFKPDIAPYMYDASGRDAEPVSARIGYLLDQLGWDSTLRNLDAAADDSLIRYLAWDSKPNALDELRSPTLDTNGMLFADPAGQITYQSRRMRQNPSPAFVFDHDAGTGVESPLEFDMSESDIVNVLEVDNAYGIKTTVRNESSIALYDEVEESQTLRLSSDLEAVQFGYWRVNRFGDAQLRIDSVQINASAHGTGALWGLVLPLRPSDVIGLRNLPEHAPDAALDYFVESVKHEVTRDGEALTWVTTLQVSPASGREAWILGDPVYGVLGETTVLHY